MILNKDLRKLTEKWIEAFNEKDIDKLLELYHDDARHYSPRVESERPATKGWLNGKLELKQWWVKSFKKLRNLNYELIDVTIGNNKVFMEYKRKVSGEDDSEVMEFLRIHNGLIIESRVLRSW